MDSECLRAEMWSSYASWNTGPRIPLELDACTKHLIRNTSRRHLSQTPGSSQCRGVVAPHWASPKHFFILRLTESPDTFQRKLIFTTYILVFGRYARARVAVRSAYTLISTAEHQYLSPWIQHQTLEIYINVHIITLFRNDVTHSQWKTSLWHLQMSLSCWLIRLRLTAPV